MTFPPPERRHGWWRALVSPQATSLLLVIAVLLLAYVTLQGKTAADSAKVQAIQNKTIILRQDQAARAEDLRARRQAVELASLARDTAAKLLAQVMASNNARDVSTQALILRTQAQLRREIENLSAAVEDLQRSLDSYARQDEERDRRRNSNTPQPRPTCLPVAVCVAPHGR